jgi:predicted TIM-barrel fold metal-dependent hydrolase
VPPDAAIFHLGLTVGEGGPGYDGVQPLLEAMDREGVARALVPVDLDRPEALRALKDHPDRFAGCYPLDPARGMEEVRKVAALVEHLDVRALAVAPARLAPPVPLDDKRLYPLYAKAVELGLPVLVRAGVPREPVPLRCQHPRRLEEPCAFFPELPFVLWNDGVGPWLRLVLTLLQRHPNLHFAAAGDGATLPAPLVEYAHAGGAGRLLFAGAGRHSALREDARDLFLAGNAARLLGVPR